MAVPEHTRPQIVAVATLRRGRYGWVQTFELPPIFRILELSCLTGIPAKLEDGAQAPVYVRFKLNVANEDKPGTVVIPEGTLGPVSLACPHCGHTDRQEVEKKAG